MTTNGLTVRKEMGKYGRADKGPLKSTEMLKCFAALNAVINVLETD